ncbi:MAG: hypothetical protein JWN56_1639 [Sphingobacteriales bacterium]|nr:hypothetical protein [Sphingobacteriales bacterium]
MESAVSIPVSFSNTSAGFVERYINIMVLFFPCTTFLVAPSVQGTTVITVLSTILFLFIMAMPSEKKPAVIKELYWFFAILLILSICSQVSNLIFELKLNSTLTLINLNKYLDTFYRISHITQTLYLISGFIIYLLIKYFSGPNLLTYLFWGVRLLCLYAIYEFAYFLIMGENGDFVTNRTLGYSEIDASIFQTINVGGIDLVRIKGYTGEPSMFTFTAFPFWVLTFGLKRWLDNMLLLFCLIFTFSTTAYLSMCLFILFWFIYKRQFKLIILTGFLIVAVMLILQMEAFKVVFDRVYNTVIAAKLSGETDSSKDRGGAMESHMEFWSHLPLPSKFVGIGFGYIRSTDFFSTLFLNTGIVGFVIFASLFVKNLFLKIADTDLKKCYQVATILLFFIMMATVPEFSYASLWIFLGLGFVMEKGGEVC